MCIRDRYKSFSGINIIFPGKIILMPENDLYKPIEIEDHMNMEIWGVVTSSVHFL